MWPSGLLCVREKSGKSICFQGQGILEVLVNIREMSGHFANYHGILGLLLKVWVMSGHFANYHGILGLLLNVREFS